MTSALVTAAVLDAVAAALFLAAGASVARRALASRNAALAGFATLWTGIGAYAAADGAAIAAHLWSPWAYPVALAVLHVKILSLVAGFGGLAAYITHLYTGRSWPYAVITVYFLVVLVGFEFFYGLRSPAGASASAWGVSLAYRYEGLQPLWNALLVLLLVPPLSASVAYARLYRRASDRRVRFRILGTSLALTLFFGSTLAAWTLGNVPGWGLAEKLLAIVTGLVMLATSAEARRSHEAPRAATPE